MIHLCHLCGHVTPSGLWLGGHIFLECWFFCKKPLDKPQITAIFITQYVSLRVGTFPAKFLIWRGQFFRMLVFCRKPLDNRQITVILMIQMCHFVWAQFPAKSLAWRAYFFRTQILVIKMRFLAFYASFCVFFVKNHLTKPK